MRTIWQGTDSLLLVSNPKQLTLKDRYYSIKLRVFARLSDKFAVEHYCCGELVKDNLSKFKMKKPLILFKTPIDKDLKVEKKKHKEFNLLYYFPKKRTKLREWIYGWDIFKEIRKQFPDINYIIVDGSKDMKEVYPYIDLLIRCNRHDGESRMVEECKMNNIPYIYTKENPSINYFVEEIKKILWKQE